MSLCIVSKVGNAGRVYPLTWSKQQNHPMAQSHLWIHSSELPRARKELDILTSPVCPPFIYSNVQTPNHHLEWHVDHWVSQQCATQQFHCFTNTLPSTWWNCRTSCAARIPTSTSMITPRFNCSQTEKSVIISMYCPSIRVNEFFAMCIPISISL